MAARGGAHWTFVILLVLLGTFLGVYLQRFDVTAPFFRDVIRSGFDLRDVDLVFMQFGLSFHLRLNLGSLLGGLVSLWILR
ncbi:hypothetical protein KAR29_05150 [Aminithiophilus ramosus]|uniref:DUF4321 domain-containing protein n=1 Tax=Aminithiophilus ramosus TaxID=3029084 RepID=A0A9Q7AKM8_9BACT|nr:hypothetical protein [Aminithiophilus ramosus]QTX33275.1 hypothetical protein KAR29_05150 [Aminithiophilus ramosus]